MHKYIQPKLSLIPTLPKGHCVILILALHVLQGGILGPLGPIAAVHVAMESEEEQERVQVKS